MAARPHSFEAKANILLANPPGAPTSAQVAANPSLAHINTYNPLVGLENLVQVADVVIQMVNSPAAKEALAEAGASAQYQVGLDTSLETPPVIDVTGVGANFSAAIQSARLVAQAVSQNLYQIQAAKHIDSRYMISSIEFVKPTSATTSVSGELRTAIEVIAIGLFLLLVTVSISQSLDERKNSKRRRGRLPSSRLGDGTPANSPTADVTNQSPQRMNDSQPTAAYRSEMQPARENSFWDRSG
jgi:hypothetical protein